MASLLRLLLLRARTHLFQGPKEKLLAQKKVGVRQLQGGRDTPRLPIVEPLRQPLLGDPHLLGEGQSTPVLGDDHFGFSHV
jgi:hypothetical protein